jgi:hypothetical protein
MFFLVIGDSFGKKVLKIDGSGDPKVLRFDGPFGPEGCGGGFAAVFIWPLRGPEFRRFKGFRRLWWAPAAPVLIKP